MRAKLEKTDSSSTVNSSRTGVNDDVTNAFENGGFEDQSKVNGKLQASVSLVEDFEKRPHSSAEDLPPGTVTIVIIIFMRSPFMVSRLIGLGPGIFQGPEVSKSILFIFALVLDLLLLSQNMFCS